MNRRNFLKTMGAAGASLFAPSSLNLMTMYKHANAAIDYSAASIVTPAVLPQVINIFLYGGPSELSGNLTNIADIELASQNSYEAVFPRITMQQNQTDMDMNPGLITPNGFWSGAGGDDMQFMLNQGYMSVYRTLMKRLDGTRSHRESLLMSQKGSLDIEMGAGVGTRLAAALYQNRTQYEGLVKLADDTTVNNIESMFLPFVSFEGDTRYFAQDPNFQIPLLMRGTTLDQNFDNPYSRGNNDNQTVMQEMIDLAVSEADKTRYGKVVNAFTLRDFLDSKMDKLTPSNSVANNEDSTGALLPTLTDAADIAANGGNAQLSYPANNRYSNKVRAAVTLAIKNPSSLYITVGGGLGGWDDHNNATTNYPARMNDLFAALKAALLHIKYSIGVTTLDGTTRTTCSNIAINMFGDFGRRVNLNAPQGGWDHGNNQNLFTFGIDDADPGSPRPDNALGKVVGRTTRVGDAGTNNQVTEPATGSYEAEPMSVASTVYKYFGVQNPELLTADDERNPDGVPAIDEAVPGEPALFVAV